MRRHFFNNLFILFFISFFAISCSLELKGTGKLAFYLPESSSRSATGGKVDSQNELPKTYDVTIKFGENIIVGKPYKAAEKIVINNLLPGNYYITISGNTDLYDFSGSSSAVIEAGKQTEVETILKKNKKPSGEGETPAPEPNPNPDPSPEPEPETPVILDTYYVKAGGTGNGSSIEKAFGSVKDAVTAIGDSTKQKTIIVDGTVEEKALIELEKNNKIIIKGQNNGTIKAVNSTGAGEADHGVLKIGFSGSGPTVTLQDITITGGKDSDYGAGINLLYGTLNVESGVFITGNVSGKPEGKGSGISVGGAPSSCNLNIKGNVTFGAKDDIYLVSGALININGALTGSSILVNGYPISKDRVLLSGNISGNYNKFYLSDSYQDQGYYISNEGKVASRKAVTALNSLTLFPSELKIIVKSADEGASLATWFFDNNSKLTSVDVDVYFASGVEEIQSGWFTNNDTVKLSSIIINCRYVASQAFEGHPELKSVILKSGVKDIQKNAFNLCSGINSVISEGNAWKLNTTDNANLTDNASNNATIFKNNVGKHWTR